MADFRVVLAVGGCCPAPVHKTDCVKKGDSANGSFVDRDIHVSIEKEEVLRTKSLEKNICNAPNMYTGEVAEKDTNTPCHSKYERIKKREEEG